jgi:hypothetical protein
VQLGSIGEFWGRNGAEDKLGDCSRVADFVFSFALLHLVLPQPEKQNHSIMIVVI